jgi:hypothetical protein
MYIMATNRTLDARTDLELISRKVAARCLVDVHKSSEKHMPMLTSQVIVATSDHVTAGAEPSFLLVYELQDSWHE